MSFQTFITSFQKFEINSYCVDQKHYSATKNIVGDKTFKKLVKRLNY